MRWCTSLVICGALALPWAAQAQEDDKGYLTAFLEENLSDAGRNVVITGFSGALSSQASVKSMTIADDAGIWITLNGVTLDWSRSALLSGRVEIASLTADEILVDRLPATDTGRLSDPEAGGFSLPELPVSVQIGKLAATRIVLAPAVMGQSVEGTLDAALSLADGQGQARLDLSRTDDGPDGQISLNASYANATRQLVLDLSATEASGGIAGDMLNLPGQPSVDLTVQGDGPVDDFLARIGLRTDGSDRLAGTVVLRGDATGGIGFSADLGGDLGPLLAPDYAAFFGDAVQMTVSGTRASSGAMQLDQVSLETKALTLKGSVTLASDGLPLAFALAGDIGYPDRSRVLLPIPGPDRTEIVSAAISVGFDSSKGDDWQIDGRVSGLRRDDISIAKLALNGSGRIARTTLGADYSATLAFSATDAVAADPALARALGNDFSGTVVARYQEQHGVLDVPRITLTSEGLDLEASGQVAGLDAALQMTGKVRAEISDLARLSDLVGRPLQGAASIDLTGAGSPLSGVFDIDALVEGQSLRVGQTELDRLLAGDAQIDVSVRRNETGLTLRRMNLTAATLMARARGQISSTISNLTATLDFTDIAVLGPGYRGNLALDARFAGTPEAGKIVLRGQGRGLAVGQPQADRVLAGTSTVAADLSVDGGVMTVTSASLVNPQVNASAAGRTDGTVRALTLQARLANLGIILPEFPGAVVISGTATDAGGGFALDLRGTGPGQIDAAVTGQLAPGGGSGNLRITGTAQSALANVYLQPRAITGPARFDLRLAGPLRLSSLSGQVSLQGGRLSDVEMGIALRDVAMTADLGGGRAQVSMQGALTTGGQVTTDGSVGLDAPYRANLRIGLVRAKLRNPELFVAEADGVLRFDGPLLGGARISGQIDIPTAEIRIPSGSISSLGAIPDIDHVRDQAPVRDTRRKAGLLGSGAAGRSGGGTGAGAVHSVDIDLVATNRLFIRGRGLDAELSGRLTLGGTTANLVPAGQFSLVRGRLDVLGKRLVLSEAGLQLQGDFVPFVAIAASNQSDGVTSTVRIEGPALDPLVTFSSRPDLPQEEVLARLLFGRDLQTLSVLQAAQLANAVATLAGRGGDGIIGRLRKNFGFDDLDVASDETGSTVVRAGKYISDNVYTEVEVGQDGKSEINLNLDLRPGVTVTGRVDADGETGLGVFLEKDY